MFKKQKSQNINQSNLTINTGGYMSVNRIEALIKNIPIIRKMILPTIKTPKKTTSSLTESDNKNKNTV
jgi:hypothetical protein